MKITEHIEYLLRQGRSPEELIELGFPKQVITKVRRQLRREKAAQPAKVPKSARVGKGLGEAGAVSADNTAATKERLASLESNLKALLQRIGALEAQGAKVVSISDLNSRLDGTPALGLRRKFMCECGASGLVALRIQCTKCEKGTWWGWFPEK